MRNKREEELRVEIESKKGSLYSSYEDIENRLLFLKQRHVDMVITEAMLHGYHDDYDVPYLPDEDDEVFEEYIDRLNSCYHEDEEDEDVEEEEDEVFEEYIDRLNSCYGPWIRSYPFMECPNLQHFEFESSFGFGFIEEKIFGKLLGDLTDFSDLDDPISCVLEDPNYYEHYDHIVDEVFCNLYTADFKQYLKDRFRYFTLLEFRNDAEMPDPDKSGFFGEEFRYSVTDNFLPFPSRGESLKFEYAIADHYLQCKKLSPIDNILDKFNEFDPTEFYLEHQIEIESFYTEQYNKAQMQNFLSYLNNDQKERLFNYFAVDNSEEFANLYLSQNALNNQIRDINRTWNGLKEEIDNKKFFLGRMPSGDAAKLITQLNNTVNRILKLSFFGIYPSYIGKGIVDYLGNNIHSVMRFKKNIFGEPNALGNQYVFCCNKDEVDEYIDIHLRPIKTLSILEWKDYLSEDFRTMCCIGSIFGELAENYEEAYTSLKSEVHVYHEAAVDLASSAEDLKSEQARWNKLTETEKTTEFVALEQLRISEEKAEDERRHAAKLESIAMEQQRIAQEKADNEKENAARLERIAQEKADNEKENAARLERLAEHTAASEEEKAKHLGRIADIEEYEFRRRERNRNRS